MPIYDIPEDIEAELPLEFRDDLPEEHEDTFQTLNR